MKQLQQPSLAPAPTEHIGADVAPYVAPWRLNLLRLGYLVLGVGLAMVTWPLLLEHSSWTLDEGTIECVLVAMSLLAFAGLRHPVRMLPLLLFEVTWKVIWLGGVALPLWVDDKLEGAARDQAGAVLWVVIIVATIPWRYVLARCMSAPADPWRRRR